MIDKIKDIIEKKDSCILATVSGKDPHCSLMSYVANEDCREIYMISLRGSKKYRNMMNNDSVSLLIDTREDNVGRKRENIKALTVKGNFQHMGDKTKRLTILEKLLSRHPHLKDFAHSDELEVFQVNVKSVELLEGVSNAYFEELD
ncbi:MAG: pyridoxamine 5'-phosphate oxidase family protein [Deltaproteobacteria bacterium]|nr:pyridoxamine 5'-phosphate oxidase family protein [Deltaproteobacteria bacterium]